MITPSPKTNFAQVKPTSAAWEEPMSTQPEWQLWQVLQQERCVGHSKGCSGAALHPHRQICNTLMPSKNPLSKPPKEKSHWNHLSNQSAWITCLDFSVKRKDRAGSPETLIPLTGIRMFSKDVLCLFSLLMAQSGSAAFLSAPFVIYI